MHPSRAGGVREEKEFSTYFVPPELATVTDISSFNYQWMVYKNYLEYAPDMIVFQSEAQSRELLGPFYGMDQDKMVGLAYWGAIEYWGESDGWPKKGWNYSYFNHTLEPYPQAYLIKSAFVPDEPVAGLDPKATAELYELIASLNREGVAILMVSHDLAAVDYASHILHIGDRLFFGTREAYLESGAGDAWLAQRKGGGA